MLVALVTALLLAAGSPQASERSRAETLARSGRSAEALEIFKQIAERDPADTDAQIWIARLDLRLGRADAAEARFREVLKKTPKAVDARLGLASTLLRKGDWRQALDLLKETETYAGQNADLFSALGRAYRRSGDDEKGFEYFDRARALSPADPDIQSGYEQALRAYGHLIGLEGFTEAGPGDDRTSGAIDANLRATPRIRVLAYGRVQTLAGSTDALGGAGVTWRASRATTVGFQAFGGSGNTSLATTDIAGAVLHYLGAYEVGASLRFLSFVGTDVIAVSPAASWDLDRTRLDVRYSYSRSDFDATGQSSGDHSVMLRETWRGWRRVWLQATYAYGIESFEQLTADRVGLLGSTTLAGAVKILAPKFDVVTTWEHQWRSNDTAVDRLTVSVVRFFR
jgi:tetratricopeptide (TPR) repeat protein